MTFRTPMEPMVSTVRMGTPERASHSRENTYLLLYVELVYCSVVFGYRITEGVPSWG